jgi:GGDEF domain-containing protein
MIEHHEQLETSNVITERRQGKDAAVLTLNLELDDLDVVADELLKEVRSRISHRLRSSDVVVQLDGNEFVVLLKDIRSPDNAATVSQSLIEIITEPFELRADITAKIDEPKNKIKVGVKFVNNTKTFN